MSAVRTYDPGQINCVFADVPISGYADGTFVTCERMTEAFTSVAGSGGEVARIRMRDKRGAVKFTLMATSPVNDSLSAIAAADEVDGSGIGVFHLKDSNGTTIATAASAWIKKLPSYEGSKDMPNREWEIECEFLELFVGGNF